jgi:pimeloyl-ACP methyl ester carboxylesterase
MLQHQRRDPHATAQRATFERDRLGLLARHGFDAASTWMTDSDGRTTYAMERGTGSCPKILIHGGLSEGSEWWPLAGRLDGRVVIPDRPGCGLTYIPEPRRSTFRRDAIRWVANLVDALGAPRVDLIGNSLGGYFSLVYALAHPDRVRRLVLVGAPAGLHRSVPLFIRLWGNPVAGRLITRRPPTDPEEMRAIFERVLVSDARRIPREALEITVEGGLLPGVGRHAFQMPRQLTTLRGIRPGLLINSEVEDLGTPTRFVWGEEDAFWPPSLADGLWDRMPDAELWTIPDAGHLPQLDHPDAVAGGVTSFLEDMRTYH